MAKFREVRRSLANSPQQDETHQVIQFHKELKLCFMSGEFVQLEQPIHLKHGESVNAIGIFVATHRGESRGALKVQIVDERDGCVVAFNSYLIGSLVDNSKVLMRLKRPIQFGVSKYKLRLIVESDKTKPPVGIYTEEPLESRAVVEGIGPAKFAVRMVTHHAEDQTTPDRHRAPGHIDYVHGRQVVGWVGWNDAAEADWRIHCGRAGENTPVTFGYRGNTAHAGLSDQRAGFVGEASEPPTDGLIDDRIVFLETEGSTSEGPALSHPLRRKALATESLASFLQRSTVIPLQAQGAVQLLIRRRRKLCLFAIYHTDSGLFRHQVKLVAELRRQGFVVVLINSHLNVDQKTAEQMKDVTDAVLLRDGDGLDFASWLTGLAYVGPAIGHVEELLLVNDSCLGPIFPLDDVFGRLRQRDEDVIGVTDSWEQCYHLQSYFVLITKKALQSPAFFDWAKYYSFGADRDRVIAEGELGMSAALMRGGLRLGAIFPYEQVVRQWTKDHEWAFGVPPTGRGLNQSPGYLLQSGPPQGEQRMIWDRVRAGIPLNPMAFFWEQLVREFKCPFVKKEHFVRDTRPFRATDLTSITELLGAEAPEALEMIRDLGKQQSRGIVPPFGVVAPKIRT